LYEAKHRTISEEAKTLFNNYVWPKNTRELEITIRKAVFDYKDIGYLEARHLRINVANIERAKDSKNDRINFRVEKKEEIDTISGIADIMKKMSEKDFEVNRGDYARYEEADSILTVKMLRKALDITRKRGKKISYLEAIRYLINNNELKSDQARIIYNGIKGIGEKYYDYKKDPIFIELEAQKEKKRKKLNKN
jgi:DNA-binding NtrC family response regulator